MHRFLWFCIIVATLGGFLFGYHTAVIAGAMIFIKKHFALSAGSQGMVVSILLLGALVGSFSSGILIDRLGTRIVFFLASLMIILGTWLACTIPSISILSTGRLLVGIGIGFYSVVTPMYLGEISPLRYRGAIVSLYQLAISFGVLVAYCVNLWLSPNEAWCAMLGWGMLPAFLQIVCIPFMVESPQWLIGKGFSEKARIASNKIGQHVEIAPAPLREQHGWKSLLAPGVRYALFLGLALSFLQQVTGVNSIFYYAPEIFNAIGYSSSKDALVATLGVGTINLLFTLVAVWLLDRIGRKALLLIGLIGMLISLGFLDFSLFFPQYSINWISASSVMIYVASFAIGLGPVTWVVISEIYPSHIRGRAMGIAVLANWLGNYLVSLLFPKMVEDIGAGGAFAIFAVMTLFSIFYIYKALPETKGKTFEEIQRLFE